MAFSESDSSEPSPIQLLTEDYPRVSIEEITVDEKGTIVIRYKGDLSDSDQRSILDALSSEYEPLSRIEFVHSMGAVIETARRMVSGMIT